MLAAGGTGVRISSKGSEAMENIHVSRLTVFRTKATPGVAQQLPFQNSCGTVCFVRSASNRVHNTCSLCIDIDTLNS